MRGSQLPAWMGVPRDATHAAALTVQGGLSARPPHSAEPALVCQAEEAGKKTDSRGTAMQRVNEESAKDWSPPVPLLPGL